jgi:DNA-binding CsgD family transcriptional regulator
MWAIPQMGEGCGEAHPLCVASFTAATRHDRNELIARAGRAGSVQDVFAAASPRLRRLVPYDAAVWLATDPATGLPVAPTRAENMARVDERDCLRLWELELRFEDVNLYADLARAPTPAAGLRLSTDDHPARSARYREFLRPAGFGDELRAVLRADGTPWASVTLFRSEDAPPFGPRETELLAGLSGPLAAAVRDHARPATSARRARGPGLLLFDASGELVSMNDDAPAWLEEIHGDVGGDDAFGVRLPLVVVSTLIQARAIAEERDDRAARVRMRSGASGAWLVCHASCLRDEDGELGETVLVIEPASASEIAPIFAASYGLSPRELQITCLVARGVGTAEIAEGLHLSAHTVRDHLKAVFEKAGVSSRGELVARLFADHAAPIHLAPGARETA